MDRTKSSPRPDPAAPRPLRPPFVGPARERDGADGVESASPRDLEEFRAAVRWPLEPRPGFEARLRAHLLSLLRS